MLIVQYLCQLYRPHILMRPPLRNSYITPSSTPAPPSWGCAKIVIRNGHRIVNFRAHKIPESLRAFWRIVSFTAANTSRIFDVSVACVRLFRLALLGSNKAIE